MRELREKIKSVKELHESNKRARGRTFTVESRGEKQMLERVDRKKKTKFSARQREDISSTSEAKSHCSPPVWLHG